MNYKRRHVNTLSLTELNLPLALNTSRHDLIDQFFVPLLRASVKYDRGVGYFSSGWIKEAFAGMSDFARNGGRARWITSPILSQEDWMAIMVGNEARQDEILRETLALAINDLCR